MISGLLWFLVDRVTQVLTYLVRAVLWGSFLFSLSSYFGWIQRFLCFLLEQTATDLCNGTPVTIGSLEIDLLRGRLWATNVVIHTPKRNEWQWESPLICRIGRVYIEHNWISSFLIMLLKMACGQGQKHILEIYTLEMSDIQGFIERKQHIFNFYLMDQWLDLPDPKTLLEEEKDLRGKTEQHNATRKPQQLQQQQVTGALNDVNSEASVDLSINAHLSINEDQVEAAFPSEYQNRSNQSTASFLFDTEKEDLMEAEEDDVMAHRQAQQLVDDMFSAVKSIGRATRKKGALNKGTIAGQIASKLKQFKEGTKGTKKKQLVMQEGVKVIKQVSQAVAKKTKDMKNVMPKVPDRREPDIPPVYARVGRVMIQDARVFTRTTVAPARTSVSTASTTSATVTTASTNDNSSKPPLAQQLGSTLPAPDTGTNHDPTRERSGSMANHGLGSKWNKPIGISEIVLRSSELCPPNSLLDEDGLPAIYQPLDKIVDVVMKRVLVGLAKGAPTRFLQTAMGELLEMEYSTMFGDNSGNNAVHERYRRSSTALSDSNVVGL